MKTILALILIANISYSQASVVPERVITPPLDLYAKPKKLVDGSIEVRVTKVSKRGEFVQNGYKKILSPDEYLSYKKSADAVFRMIPKQNSNQNAPIVEEITQGTAFHIGSNLVLTNQHVLDPKRENVSECRDFQIKDLNDEAFDCKKVHFCNKKHDVCLIEVETIIKRKKGDCFLCLGPKYEVSIAQGPSLKLKSSYAPSPEKWSTEVTTAIGNSAGFGIHYSQGLGASFNKSLGLTYFYAPITSGNSGGPLLNQEGDVIGLIKQQSNNRISSNPDEAYNAALSIELMITLIREGLRDDPETLLKFNTSVIE